jgi:RNA polymerase sigma-70 factor (ECF subfamily)
VDPAAPSDALTLVPDAIRACPALSAQPDERLMAAVRSRLDEVAFEELARRHAGRALGTARSMLGSTESAEDAVQECLLRLVRARRSYRPGMPFAPWFRTLLRNACRDELRRRLRLQSQARVPVAPASVAADPHAAAETGAAARSASQALQRLPDADRRILAMRIHGELGFDEIGAALGLSAECVRKRAYRALERLRGELAGPRR